MTKLEYFYKAIQTPLYKDVQWLITLLSYTLFKEENKTLYALKYEKDECFFFNDDNVWEKIEGSYPNKGLFVYNEPMDLPPNILENAKEGITDTTIGRILQNKILLCHPFHDKIPFINKRFMPSDIEKIVIERLKDTPPPDATRKREFIYVDEYIKYNDAALFLSQLTQVCVPGVTEKAILPPPTAKERLNQLLEQYKDSLDDPSTVAAITNEMRKLDEDFLKGDRSLGFLIKKGKDMGVVRPKMFLTYGFDKGFDDTSKVDYIPRPLCEGIDYAKLDSYINGSRSGSFSRGAETQLGGVSVKELLRSSSNAAIVEEDCHSTLGIDTLIHDKNAKYFIGFSIIDHGKTIKLDKDNISRYVNTTVSMRSPAFCRTKGTGYCATCCGPNLSLHTNGISAAVSAAGSVFMNTAMKAMHGKQLSTIELDFDKLIS